MPSPDDKPLWQVLEELFPKLKPAQRALAQSFVEQARQSETDHVPLAELLQSHFGDTTQRALVGLRQSKKRLNEELAALGAGIELAVDESGKLETRVCYLRAPVDKKSGEVEDLADTLNYDRDRGKHVPPKARPLNEPVKIEIPISYSHVNKKLVRELHARLQVVLNARNLEMKYLLRRDERDTELSDTLDPQIAALFKNGTIALFMLSVDFFNSNYCQKKEVPKFIDTSGKNRKGKRAICIPVALKHEHLTHVPNKLKQRVIAFHEDIDERPKSWQQLCEEGRESEKDAFLHRVADEIIKAAAALIKPDDTSPDGHPPSGKRDKKPCTEDVLHEFSGGGFQREINPKQYTQLRARYLGTLDRKDEEGLTANADETGVDLIPALIGWAKDHNAPPFCALLGEYGTGKTVSCQMLADQINTERKTLKPGELPLALYFDLRRVDAQQLSDFAIEPIIEQLLKSADYAHKLKARELIDWVRAHPALVIFDGLDEVLVHLSPKRGQDFTRALWSIYPPSYWQPRADVSKPSPGAAGKLLISCRSHYFRTIADERALFVGQDRESVRASDYRAYLMLPFNDDQIVDYLKRNFPQRDPTQTLELIADVYNLKELAQRPILLRHIGGEVAELEQRKIAGGAVNAAVLYELFVERWLRRDDAKHQLSLPHKRILMEHLAAELTRRGVRELAYDRVEEWLDHFIADRPDWESVYRGKDREILKEDLRTATFIVRPDEKKFRFAHTSLQEYFLAGYLLYALMAGEAESCCLPLPSPETFTFFAERWQAAQADRDDRLPAAERTLAALLEQAAPGRSETAFSAWLALHRLGLSPSRPAHFDLRGCDLSQWTIDGGESSLVLGAVDLSNANLWQSCWRRVQLPGARLDQANASDSEWHEVNLDHAVAHGADVDGAIFRHTRLVNADFSGITHAGARYLFCERTGAQLPPTPPTRIAPQRASTALAALRSQVFIGHTGVVLACAFSADGRWLVSGGTDGVVRLWDLASRTETQGFSGHAGGVWTCVFSPDGRWLASGGDDSVVRLWDLASWTEIRSFSGHTGRIWACAFSADRRWLASAGEGGAVRLWDLTGSQMKVQGFKHVSQIFWYVGWVLVYAFSADGRWLASAGEDGAVRLWDLASRTQMRELHEHRGVRACTFSPDGRWLASGGTDGVVRLWNLANQMPAHQFRGGHFGGVRACAFSPDGRWLASGGNDGRVRLWDLASRTQAHEFRGRTDTIRACAFSPDGRWLASVRNDNEIRLWDLANRAEAQGFSGRAGLVWWTCAFSADGRWLATGGTDGMVRLWDLASRTETQSFSGHAGGIWACAFSPDGRWLASGGDDGTVRLWDLASRTEAPGFSGHTGGIRACAFSADGRWLASAGEDGVVRLWNLTNRVKTLDFSGHIGGVRICTFSADGRWLASAGEDGVVRLWDLVRGALAHGFSGGHIGGVRTCAFSMDGRQLASGGEDSVVRLWDLVNQKEVGNFRGHFGRIRACVFSVDGQWLASGGDDGTVRLWDVAAGVCRAALCHLPGGEVASADFDRGRFTAASPNAWRYLGYGGLIDGEWRTYPAEVFGPIPAMREIGKEEAR